VVEVDPADVPVFILAGGMGTRIKEETDLRPKPMVPVGNHPILWHIMKKYSKHGFKRFIICSGFKSESIKSYFLNYEAMNSDFTVDLGSHGREVHSFHHAENWKVTVAFTGEKTMTGGRIGKAVSRYLGDAEYFAVTYGDGVTDADLGAELQFHVGHGKIGTVLGVSPPSRFGVFVLDGDKVTNFSEKPNMVTTWVNGGFFFFKREFANFVSEEEDLVLERGPLEGVASSGELMIYRHEGFWQCMDTQRDREVLEALWESGNAPWIC
jgi:glucose-1-phosphate cytidylyltransferase